MDNVKIIKIRQATASESDLNGIVNVYRGQSIPWGNITDCTSWVTKRLERGFYIQVAEIDGKIVGHGEWIISDEPDRKFLYLGMLEIDKDYQRKGIGRAMIADGIEHAKKNNCVEAVTSPDMETGADIFYRKCGFKDGRKQYILHIKTEEYRDYKFEGTKIEKVPFSVIKEKRFVFGKGGQFSSRHMWEVMNEKPSVDVNRRTPAILLSEGTYIQIHTWENANVGSLYVWTNNINYSEIIKSALSFGYSLGMKHIDFEYLEDEESFLDGFEVHDRHAPGDFEQIYYIN
ncbi:MAG: GNAT family N-acetyltransferase [Oscillospiraceae bacterium]|nr:GNAT family N-acetyltransferase [Oscillospiraceae bacterium]